MYLAALPEILKQEPVQVIERISGLTHFYQGNRSASEQDLELAMRAEPNNPIYRNLQRQLSAPEGQTAAKP